MTKGVFKPKEPGDTVVMKLLKGEEQLLIDWINMQTTSSDSIRFLIQKEIAQNGLRDLQKHIPQIRDIASLRAIYSNGGDIGVTTSPVFQQTAATIPADVPAVGGNPSSHTSDLNERSQLTPKNDYTDDYKSEIPDVPLRQLDSSKSSHTPESSSVTSNQPVPSGDSDTVVQDHKEDANQAISNGHETTNGGTGETKGNTKPTKRRRSDQETIAAYTNL